MAAAGELTASGISATPGTKLANLQNKMNKTNVRGVSERLLKIAHT
jgi:hypothetical protein